MSTVDKIGGLVFHAIQLLRLIRLKRPCSNFVHFQVLHFRFPKFPSGELIYTTYLTGASPFLNNCYDESSRHETRSLETALVLRFGEQPTLTAFRLQLIRCDTRPLRLGQETGRVEVGTIILSQDDLKGLDKLIEFYRWDPPGGCTTTDTVSLRVYRGNRILADERFWDGSCATYDMEDITTFWELIDRLEASQ